MWREQLEQARSAGPRALAGLAAALVLLAVGGWELGRSTAASDGYDFFQFWALGQHLEREAVDDLYSDVESERAWALGNRLVQESGSESGQRASAWSRQLYAHGVKPISTPWYYTAFAKLPTGDYDRDLFVFQWASSALLALALVWLAVELGAGWPIALGALGAALLWFGPIHADIEVSNMNRLQCGAIVLAALAFRRGPLPDFLAGVAIAMVVWFKPSLFALPLFLWAGWFAARRYSTLVAGAAGMAAGTLMCVLAAWLVFGALEPWAQWVEALAFFQSQPLPVEHMNLASTRLFYEWAGFDLSVFSLLALLGSFGWAAWRGRDVRTEHRELRVDVAAVAAAGVLPLLGTQLAWDHYWVLTLPVVWLLLAPGPLPRAWSLVAAAVLFVFCAHRPLISAFGLDAAWQLAAWLVPANLALWAVLLVELVGQRDAGSVTTNT